MNPYMLVYLAGYSDYGDDQATKQNGLGDKPEAVLKP